jgi:hypothetical protein
MVAYDCNVQLEPEYDNGIPRRIVTVGIDAVDNADALWVDQEFYAFDTLAYWTNNHVRELCGRLMTEPDKRIIIDDVNILINEVNGGQVIIIDDNREVELAPVLQIIGSHGTLVDLGIRYDDNAIDEVDHASVINGRIKLTITDNETLTDQL